MTTFIANHRGCMMRQLFVEENGTSVNLTLRKELLPENTRGDWSVSLEEAQCNFRIPLLKSQEILSIRARIPRVNAAMAPATPNYEISYVDFSESETVFTCGDIYSVQAFVQELSSFFERFDRMLKLRGFNPAVPFINSIAPIAGLATPTDFSEAAYSEDKYCEVKLGVSENLTLTVNNLFFKRFFLELTPMGQEILGWGQYVGMNDTQVGTLTNLNTPDALNNLQHNEGLAVDSTDGYHLLYSPIPITSSLDQRVALECHVSIPTPNKIYIVDGKEQKRFILHSFDLTSDNMMKSGVEFSASGSNAWGIIREAVKIGNHKLLHGTMNNTIAHLLPGTIQVINVNWLVMRYDPIKKKYITENLPTDNDSRFSLKLLFCKQK